MSPRPGRFDALDQLLMQLDGDRRHRLIDTTGAVTPLTRMAMFPADGILSVASLASTKPRPSAAPSTTDELGVEAGHAIRPVGMLFVRPTPVPPAAAWANRVRRTPSKFPSGPLYVFQTHIRQQSSVRDHPGLRSNDVFR